MKQLGSPDRVSVILLLAAAAIAISGHLASAEVLAPHRAVYDMTLDKAATSAGISALSGRMVFELRGNACEGYKQRMRFVTETRNPSGKQTLTDQRSTFHEEPDGRRFRFESRQFRDERLAEHTEGTASRSKARDKLQIQIRKPKKRKLDIGRPVLYPVEHSIRLLEAARAGERLFTVDLYDGSEKGEKVFATTAALGERLAAGVNATLEKVKGADGLDTLAAWPISLSYFEVDGKRQDAVPAYELSFIYFENGVSRKLFIDYGSFSMRGELVSLELFKQKPCPK